MTTNELYFVVLPLIHISGNNYGLTEQALTLLPDVGFATEFHNDEVQAFIDLFQNRTKYLTGGHVSGYVLQQVPTEGGRVIVKVIQRVA